MNDDPRLAKRLPTWGQGLLVAGAGLVLGAGGCTAFVNFYNQTLGAIGGVAFFGGLALVVIGVIGFLVGVIKAIAAGWGRPAEQDEAE